MKTMNQLQSTQLSNTDELLSTKLTVPRLRAPLVARPSLLARLDEGLDRKLTLISAPAGFGKTTLVSQWFVAHQQAGPTGAWIALDAGDNDPVRFWRYFFNACRHFGDNLGQNSLGLLRAAQPAFETALTRFINEMAQLGERHILVLEDYQFIASPEIHETVLFLLDHLPDTLHLMIVTRQDPPLPLARLRARHELNELGASDLRFSLAETQTLLQQALPTPLPAETIARLDARTEGWVAALRLLILALQGRQQAQEVEQFIANFSGGHGHILEYLVEEVLDAQPQSTQEFLLQTSFLHRLTGSLCNAVTGRSDSVRLLEQMERANLFLISLDGAQFWYRYHALFAEAMHHYARNRLDSRALNLLYARASHWYEENGMLGEAFETAIAMQEYERAANLLEQIIAPQLVQNQHHTLRRWLEQLPEDVLRLHPQLSFTFAIAILFTSDRSAPQTHILIQPLLQMAEQTWRGEGNLPKVGELMAFRSLVTWFKPDLIQSIAEAREALTLLPAENAQWRGICLLFVGLEGLLDGQLHKARKELLQGLELNKIARNSYGILDTLLLLGRVCAEQGELRQSLHYYQQSLAELERRPMSREMAEIRKGRALAGLSRLELEWNRIEKAERHAAQALETSRAYAEEDLRVESALLLVKIEQARGNFIEAQEQLHALMAQTRNPHTLAEIRNAQARQDLMAGDIAGVQRWSSVQEDYPLPHLQEEAEMLLNARLYLVQGEAASSLRLLYEWQPDARAGGRTRSEIEMFIITSQAANALGDIPCAKQALVQALKMAQPEGYQRLFVDYGEGVAELLRSTLREIKDETLSDYARCLLLAFAEAAKQRARENGASRTGDALDVALLVEPLSAQERRVLRLLVADLSNPEIAEELVVSLNTVKTHVKNIYSKLDVHSRDEARAVARQLNLL